MLLKRLLPIIALTFVNVIGFSLLIPVFPSIVESFGYGTIMYGLLLSTYSICQFFASPVLGSISDRYGRKPVLIVSHFGTLLSWILMGSAYFIPNDLTVLGFSLAFLVILVSRIIDGLTGGNVSVSNAYVSDITEDEERSKAYGYLGATFGIGILIGPVIGALSASTSIWFLGTVVLAALFSVIALFLLVFMKESNAHLHNNNRLDIKTEIKSSLLFVSKLHKYSDKKIIHDLFRIRYLHAFVFTSYISIFVIMLGQRYELSTQQIGYVFTVIGLFSIINQGLVVERFVRAFGQKQSLFWGTLSLSIGLILVSFASNVYMFILFSYVVNFGIANSLISIKTLLNRNTGVDSQGEVMGIDESLISLNSAYVPFISGIAYSFITYRWFAVLGIAGLGCVYYISKLQEETK